MATVWDGIVIGSAGGSIAGITVWAVQYFHNKATQCLDGNKIYKWLKKNTTPKDEDGDTFKTTRTIASWNNLTEDRVRYICSIDGRIYLSTGSNEGLWSVHERTQPSVYENRGITSL